MYFKYIKKNLLNVLYIGKGFIKPFHSMEVILTTTKCNVFFFLSNAIISKKRKHFFELFASTNILLFKIVHD